MIVAYVDGHKEEFGIEPICEVMQFAPSTYYAAKTRPLSQRAIRDAVMKVAIVTVHQANYEVYGVRKMWKAMRRAGEDIGRDQVARLMRELGIEGVRRGRKVRTTRADEKANRPPDLVERRFVAERPNELWVTDLTYVPTWAGMVYVSFITDVFSRRIVGWRVASNMRTDMVLDSLEMARWARGTRLDGLVCHSDAGSQGEINRSSQHLSMMEVSDGATTADGGPGASPGDAVAGAADSGASCGARVLASDRAWQEHRGCIGRCRGVGPRGVALVSSRWRDDAVAPRRAVGSVSVVRGA